MECALSITPKFWINFNIDIKKRFLVNVETNRSFNANSLNCVFLPGQTTKTPASRQVSRVWNPDEPYSCLKRCLNEPRL